MTARVPTVRPDEKWQEPRAGERYREGRWGATRRRAVDPRLVRALARRHGFRGERWLDVGCGPGRLRNALAARWVGLDASRAMLAGVEHPNAARVAGKVEALPFRDGAFELVVACRLLHHFRERERLDRALAELARVSSRLVIVSFWDAASWPALRRRLGWARDEGPTGRVALTRAELGAAARDAGAEVVELRAAARFLSQQTFAVLEPR